MNNTCIAIRTHLINGKIAQLVEKLKHQFKPEDIFIVLDGTKSEHKKPSDFQVIEITSSTLKDLQLPEITSWGWRCGDYFLYTISMSTNYDYYWLIEPDVGFHINGLSRLINDTRNDTSDFLAVGHGIRTEEWYWSRHLRNKKKYGCLFPLTRTSKMAIKFLYESRVQLASELGSINEINWPNDEGFVSTSLEEKNYVCKDLQSVTTLDFKNFSSSIPILDTNQTEFSIFHPCLDWIEFLQKFPEKTLAIYRKGENKKYLTQSLRNLNKDQLIDIFSETLNSIIKKQNQPKQ